MNRSRNPRKIYTYHYQYHDVPVDVSYYHGTICHISFPTFRCGIYRNEFRSDSVTVIYLDQDPESFWEKYLFDLFFERFDTTVKNQYNEIALHSTRFIKYFRQVLKSMLTTGELLPV